MTDRQIRIETFNDPIYVANGMIISFGPGRPCWLIDPGLPPQAQQMLAYIAEQKLSALAILLTHCHADHFAGVDQIREAHPELPLYLAKQEWHMLDDAMENLSGRFGMGITASTDNLRDLAPGIDLELDETKWTALDVSGHSPGGRVIYCAALGLAFVGDAVFAGGIGRTDFHNSDPQHFLKNIHANIMTLPDETRLIPGHGPSTTVATERTSNTFLADSAGSVDPP